MNLRKWKMSENKSTLSQTVTYSTQASVTACLPSTALLIDVSFLQTCVTLSAGVLD
jgi:hypothetical protein